MKPSVLALVLLVSGSGSGQQVSALRVEDTCGHSIGGSRHTGL